MDNDSIEVQNSYICFSNFKGCQYKILDNNVFYCKFFDSFMKSSKVFKIERVKICPELKAKLLHHDYLASYTQKQSRKFLAKVRIGEVVYCTTEMEDVIFLRSPKNQFGLCTYKTFEGMIKEARTMCFRRISRGNKYSDYKTTSTEDLNASEILARENGFRVEKVTLKDHYLLKIYGDKQEDVDHFVICLENNYFFY